MAELSIFTNIEGENLQLFVDSRLDKFNQPWYKQYFPFAAPQLSLSYTSVLGESVITSAASVVSRDAETPLRARQALSKLSGEIPAIKVMRKLNESHVREYMSLQDMQNIKDETKRDQALKLIWDDVKYVADAVDKRLDVFAAQAISTGKIDINIDTNPDGIVLDPVDLLLPAGNKINAAVEWSDPAATPLTDLRVAFDRAIAAGGASGRIIIDAATYQAFATSEEVKATVGSFFGVSQAAQGAGVNPITRDRINEFMTASGLPQIEVINLKVGIEKNGVSTVINPWEASNIAFVPSGFLGEVKNAIAVEEQRPVSKVVYAKKENTLISKWSNNEPFGEWTKGELNAFFFSTKLF